MSVNISATFTLAFNKQTSFIVHCDKATSTNADVQCVFGSRPDTNAQINFCNHCCDYKYAKVPVCVVPLQHLLRYCHFHLSIDL